MKIKSFRSRLLLVFTALAGAVLLFALIAIWLATSQQSERTLERELEVSERVFAELVDVRAQQLQQAAEVLTTDFGFREAIASSDENTIISALVNHGQRIGTDLIVVQSPQGEEIAATHATQLLPPLATLTNAPVQAQFVTVNEEIFQIVTVPVRAPNLIAWATLGFAIDDDFAVLMRQLTHADITFLNQLTGTIYATSLDSEQREMMAENASNLQQRLAANDIAAHVSQYNRDSASINTEANLMIIFSTDKLEATQEFLTLQRQYIGIALATLIFAGLLATFTARKISQPITALTDAAKKLGAGDYREPVSIHRADEFGALSDAFEGMRQGIAEREQQIIFQLEHDLLTGLPNRVSIRALLKSAIESQQSGYVVLMNVARFGEVNDRFGQQVGDELLRMIAERLRAAVPKNWSVGHLGGDEFVLVGKRQSEPQVNALIVSLKTELSLPWWLEETSYMLDFHAGYLAYPHAADDADSILRRAQLCARQAKRASVFAVAYSQGMDEQYLRRLQIVQSLPSAVREQRLQLHFQPKLSCQTGQVLGVEALLRWRDEQLGVVRPDEFIPLAEQTGEIQRLTRWVCGAALDQLQLWHEQGLQLSLAINLSALDLQWSELVAFVTDSAKQRGLSPAWITLEVTESAVMVDPEQAISRLQELREVGFKIAIDDYGTGYASLAQLKRLPADELKLDRSFIQHIASIPEDETIVRSTILLAHELKLTTVAEGIEEDSAWQVLKQLGCDTVQGYYFSRPLAAAQFEEWLDNYQRESRHG
ncbi:bifunctional diguanylate cyclase/phosphodiesterase [Pseudidiomarina andamanensis]|uniref:EAL domain-containing protein n=1 Tax=Pseudidiomarina andamanensis TaxID=1940690 RepID=A0AA92IKW4_9GAMM|nr:EAL domain-containing protein [Pseudidiomarina andamanensis]MDS0217998.1 EAL domain-containing protein [Pseudidiomarina andamanensis]QGT94891.1 EAL domain-containing protein [Pseudidiomarina andamanensis]